jgi:hypothetical protein
MRTLDTLGRALPSACVSVVIAFSAVCRRQADALPVMPAPPTEVPPAVESDDEESDDGLEVRRGGLSTRSLAAPMCAFSPWRLIAL